MPDQKERISAHIAQLEDMRADYPEAKDAFRLLINHLNGLRRVKNSRNSFVSPSSFGAMAQNTVEA